MEKTKQRRTGDKTERLEMRCTPAEKEMLVNMATAVGLSVSAFLLACALGDRLGQMMIDGFEVKKK